MPEVSLGLKYLMIGLLPQLIAWGGLTVSFGSLFGSLAVAIFHRRKETLPVMSRSASSGL